MSKIWNWLKEHPYISGGIAFIGVILLFMLTRSGGSSSASGGSASSGPSDALQAAGINAQAQVQAASIAASAQTAQVNANADVSKQYIQSQVAIANINSVAAIEQYRIAANAQIAQDIADVTINAPVTTSHSGGLNIFGLKIGGKDKTSVANTTPAINALTGLVTPAGSYSTLNGTGLSGTGASGANN